MLQSKLYIYKNFIELLLFVELINVLILYWFSFYSLHIKKLLGTCLFSEGRNTKFFYNMIVEVCLSVMWAMQSNLNTFHLLYTVGGASKVDKMF